MNYLNELILSVSNLKKVFKDGLRVVRAIDDLSFKMCRGEIFGLLGPNGAGKTTTINILTGITTLDEGKITFLGRPYDIDNEAIRSSINFASGYAPLAGNLTVYQNLIVYAMIFNIPNANERIFELLGYFDLEKLKNRKINTLSSGESVRVGLCKCLINKPQLLFLDECTIGLDPIIASKTRKIIKEMQKMTNMSILFTSHNMAEVEELCDRIGFMQGGKMLMTGTPLELKKKITTKNIMHIYGRNLSKLREVLQDLQIMIHDETLTKISLEFTKEKQEEVIKKIFLSEANIDKLDIEEPSLEQVFVHLSGKKV